MMAARQARDEGARGEGARDGAARNCGRRTRLPDLVRTALAHDGLMLALVAVLVLVAALL